MAEPKTAYRPLNRQREEIRLLHLHPATSSEKHLRGTLQHVSLRDAEYSALSYVWGQSESNRCAISLTYKGRNPECSRDESLQLPETVGSNLALALRCMRKKLRTIVIWVDALCINQKDKDEQGWQVTLMVQIYTQATTVLAWLGPHLGEDAFIVTRVKEAFETADEVWTLAKNIARSHGLDKEDDWLEACFSVANANVLDAEERSEARLALRLRDAVVSNATLQCGLLAMKDLSRTQYFTRIWILQETGRAKELIFHYARRQMNYRPIFFALSLANSLRNLYNVPILQEGLRDMDIRFLSCLTARTTCTQGRSLRDVLEVAYFASLPGHHSKDPKDQIYGRLGLSKNPNSLKVDYRLSVPQVFTIAARFLLAEGFTDFLIVFRPYRSLEGPYAPFLPSWAYDWTKKGLATFAKYRASKDTVPDISFIPFPNPKSSEALTITGISIGRIQAMSKNFSTIVTNAGLSKVTVANASLRSAYSPLPFKQQQDVANRILRAHDHFGTLPSTPELAHLFHQTAYPLALFWNWWMHSLVELHTLLASSDPSINTHPGSTSADPIVELLYREVTPTISAATTTNPLFPRAPSTPTPNSATTFSNLTDLTRWLKLLSSSDRATAESAHASLGGWNISESGVEVAEAFFRSAWGMRAARLDSGRWAYVPEPSRVGDSVVVLHGVHAPVVLRGAGAGRVGEKKEEAYEIVGPGHVAGVMRGEAMEEEGVEVEGFVIV